MKLDMPQPDAAIEFTAPDGSVHSGGFSREWVNFMTKLKNDAVWRGRSGTTAQRPTDGLEVGTPYYDTTLGKAIWVHTPSPAPAVWHDATGAVV